MDLAYHTPKIVTEHIFFHGFDEFYMNLSWHMKMFKKNRLITYLVYEYNDGNTIDMVNYNTFREQLNKLRSLCTQDAQNSLS